MKPQPPCTVQYNNDLKLQTTGDTYQKLILDLLTFWSDVVFHSESKKQTVNLYDLPNEKLPTTFAISKSLSQLFVIMKRFPIIFWGGLTAICFDNIILNVI